MSLEIKAQSKRDVREAELIILPSYLMRNMSEKDFAGGASGKESSCQCRRCRFDPLVRKIPGEGTSNPLQYSCLNNPMDRGTWWATVYGITKVKDTNQ